MKCPDCKIEIPREITCNEDNCLTDCKKCGRKFRMIKSKLRPGGPVEYNSFPLDQLKKENLKFVEQDKEDK
jgi:hypothetical protein